MKKAKFLIIPLLATFLAGCSSNSIAGTYGFRLGKTGIGETFFGITLALTDEVVLDSSTKQPLGKKMEFSFSMNNGYMANNEQPQEVNAMQSLSEGLAMVGNSEVIPDFGDFGFSGYYIYNPALIQRDAEGEEIIPVGVRSLFFYDDEGKKEELELPLNPDLVEKVMYNTYNGSSFTLVIPVSIEDIILQLYWYGFDVYNPTTEIPVHQVGSSPTDEEIANINLTYPLTHEGEMYRRFYRLHMSLSKN